MMLIFTFPQIGLAGPVATRSIAKPAAKPATQTIDFIRDVRPILTENCFACHGADDGQRQGGLRLDTATSHQPGASGRAALVPGKPEASEALRRVQAGVMPPPATGKQLTAAQIETLRRWVASGAKYAAHWAFEAPKRATVPTVKAKSWPRNAIDHFILARLEHEKLAPSAEADRVTLIRRLSFDLLGLPPKAKEVDEFVNDKSPKAYESAVERLLKSPHFGERMAVYWLDVVRYADSAGYHSDNPRNVSPYRDWVIRAFNENQPFDQFTIEQLAGDLLPNATLMQRVGSAYNRLLQTTEEGGAQPKEYQAKYDADRVRNTSVAWLGVTMGCAECHNHKYDPFTAKDFYSFAAFFADVQETPVGRREPGLLLASPPQEAQLKQLDDRLSALRARLATQTPELAAAQTEWEQRLNNDPNPQIPPALRIALATPLEQRSAKQRTDVEAHFRSITPLLQSARAELAVTQKQRDDLYNAIAKCIVSNSVPPREIRIKKRGNWQDDSGEVCAPAVPALFISGNEIPRAARNDTSKLTRLDFARWVVAPDNPLTARVFVNRLWKLCYGAGLSRRLDDFGTQGSPPSHPALLDWLAVEFRERGWNVKHMVRLMVNSATYRQTSITSTALRARDPQNELLARQSSWRLEAEFVRDNALAVSGLLVNEVGGRTAFPYQPAGYWSYLNFPTREWQNDQGAGLFRRGVYTHWQRTFLHPSLLAFDAPNREECCVERPRSNIPQQALVLLNDPQYVEAARVFAQRILQESGGDVTSRLTFAFRNALSRTPAADEATLLTNLLKKHQATYAADREAAKQLIVIGDTPAAADLDAAELAAWTSVARTLLNLHETITRR